MTVEPENPPIVIQTRKGRLINCECPRLPMSPEEVERCRLRFDRETRPKLQFPLEVQERRGPTLDYNCHGLTFLVRRAWLADDDALGTVLADDGYDDVSLDRVLPGDIVVYEYPNGKIEHTGIVIHVDTRVMPRMPYIMSKWGDAGEYIHAVNNSPYRGRARFLREASDVR
jgi:hypothetical protein